MKVNAVKIHVTISSSLACKKKMSARNTQMLNAWLKSLGMLQDVPSDSLDDTYICMRPNLVLP